jgi:hypothetical protein
VGYLSCDTNPSNGCEQSIYDVNYCGNCSTVCVNAHGTTSCPSGICSPVCAAGYGNCDGIATNGCETQTNTTFSCGGCNIACTRAGATATCSTGACAIAACNTGFANCNGVDADGCEVYTNTDPNHCGDCNTVCSGATPYCNNGVCGSTCPSGTADCNGLSVDGCEAQLATDPSNCGGCAIKCGTDSTCSCASNACSGGTIYFSEDFSDNSRGWALGPEWAIGPTLVGSSGSNADPATDHSPSSDNGVAGVMLGAMYTTTLHPPEYITSPVINLTALGATGPVNLTFWRWLNSDYPPYVTETIDVFNGSTWVNLYTGASSVFNYATTWTRFTYDVTPYKNPAFQIRFGHAVGSAGVIAMGGWNIDDLTLSNGTCN